MINESRTFGDGAQTGTGGGWNRQRLTWRAPAAAAEVCWHVRPVKEMRIALEPGEEAFGSILPAVLGIAGGRRSARRGGPAMRLAACAPRGIGCTLGQQLGGGGVRCPGHPLQHR